MATPIEIDILVPFETKFPTRVFAEVDFPRSVRHNGSEYRTTGKVGRNFKTGLPAAEYKASNQGRDCRVWLLCDGSIQED